jgi:hypothetical protein
MADESDIEKKSPLLSGWMIVAVVAIVAVAAVGITALVTHSSSSSKVTTTTMSPIIQSTTTAASTAPSQPVPLVLVCSGTPEFEPSTLHWCSSLCSSYLQRITWTSWTATSATGTGVYMTNDGVPDCMQGTWTAHPGYSVTLNNPADTSYCSDSGQAVGLLFTNSSIYGGPLPGVKPPCL